MASDSFPVQPGARGEGARSPRLSARPDVSSAYHPGQPSAFDLALAAYTQQRYHAAFEALSQLADRGQPHAARIVLQMAEHGTRLYGGHFEASVATRQRWRALAATLREAA